MLGCIKVKHVVCFPNKTTTSMIILVICILLMRLASGNTEKIVLSRQDFHLKGEREQSPSVDMKFSTPSSVSWVPYYDLRHFNLSKSVKYDDKRNFVVQMAPIYVSVDGRWFDYWDQLEIRVCWSASVRFSGLLF